ncbi:GerW family sporulation protein [Haladaptatus sp. NG-WS-4]
MDLFEQLQSVVERISQNAGVETVYGDPIEVGDRTVVPVAKVWYGFGGGGDESGGGLGGGVGATPVGIVELTPDETRFVRFSDARRVGIVLAVGFVLGVLFERN